MVDSLWGVDQVDTETVLGEEDEEETSAVVTRLFAEHQFWRLGKDFRWISYQRWEKTYWITKIDNRCEPVAL